MSMRYVRGVMLCLAVHLTAVGALSADQHVEVRTDRPANVFTVGERLQMVVYADAPTSDFRYKVYDHEEVRWESGWLRAGPSSPALLELSALPTGLYTLRIRTGGAEVARETLAVVPHPDEGIGDGRIFGISHRPATQEQWDALALMGMRNLRVDFAWPASEPTQGEYDMRYVDYVVENAKARGIQLTVLTGHTPKFYSMPPVDREGRVASAWFTWAPADTIEWFNYLDFMGDKLLDEGLPAAVEHTTGRPMGSGKPLVTAWEIWSEADQNFYYGDWNRYLDMLRISYCTLKQYDDRVPVVYGSCGHWTEASYTVQSNCQDYFDLMAHHPGGIDPNHSMGHWFINMPQVFIKTGGARESTYSESYFHPLDPQYEAGFQLRLFATLKAWRQRQFIRSGCTGAVVGDVGVHDNALLWMDGEKLIPREAYVGFAVARWLLEDAVYVGPLVTPSNTAYTQPQPPGGGTQVELFLKHGRPLVVGWGDHSQSLRLRIDPGAQVIDHMGRVRDLTRNSYNMKLGPNAEALYGVECKYVVKALKARTELLLTTELGYHCERNSGYIDALEQDAAIAVREGFADEVRAGIELACRRLRTHPDLAAGRLVKVQQLLGEGMIEAARRYRDSGGLPPVAGNTIWRLAQFSEDLGMIADSLTERWPRGSEVSDEEITALALEAEQLRSQKRARDQGAECPFAERLLDRAAEQLDGVRMSEGRNRGAWWAARGQVRAARAVMGTETPVLRRVFAVVNFPTSEAVTKGTLLSPSLQHEAQVRVYNFLDEAASGWLNLTIPDDWGEAKPAVSFTAPAGSCSDLVSVPFEVPENPRPWVDKCASRPCGDLQVSLPEPLAPNTDAWIGGTVTGLPSMPDMKYRLCVGSYAPSAGGAQLASR